MTGAVKKKERGKKQGIKKVESDWKRPLASRGQLASKCVLDLNYSHVTELFNKDWPTRPVSWDFKSCWEGNRPHFRATNFHRDSWWPWFYGNIWWGLYLYLDLLCKQFVFRSRKYPWLLWKVTETPKDMDIQMSKYHAFEPWNSARGVRWATIRARKNQGLIAWSK